MHMRIARRKRKIPWYIWPFWALFRLIGWIVGLTGRLLAIILGVVFMIVGVVLTLTIIGAIGGIPLIIVGFMLVLRGIF